jgi:hypothetical protein
MRVIVSENLPKDFSFYLRADPMRGGATNTSCFKIQGSKEWAGTFRDGNEACC